MGKDRENVQEVANLKAYMVDILKNSNYSEAPAHLQLLIMLKALEELYEDANNARFMMNQLNRFKNVKGLEQTHRFAQKTLLTQYVLSLCKLLEPSPKKKVGDGATGNQKENFSIPSLLKLTYEQFKEIQSQIPTGLKHPGFSLANINRQKQQYRDLKDAKEALFNFRNKALAHIDAHYAFDHELRQQDVEQWVAHADDLLELCRDILSFYFRLIHEEFSSTPSVAKELLNRSSPL